MFISKTVETRATSGKMLGLDILAIQRAIGATSDGKFEIMASQSSLRIRAVESKVGLTATGDRPQKLAKILTDVKTEFLTNDRHFCISWTAPCLF